MSSRRVIRDSDDEGDDDAGLSPQKHSHVSAMQEGTTSYVELGCSAPAEAGSQVQSGHGRSTGSTGTCTWSLYP